MARGVINVVLGGVMIIGGASGKLVLIGTNSGIALMAIGAVVAGLGVYRIVRSQKQSGGSG